MLRRVCFVAGVGVGSRSGIGVLIARMAVGRLALILIAARRRRVARSAAVGRRLIVRPVLRSRLLQWLGATVAGVGSGIAVDKGRENVGSMRWVRRRPRSLRLRVLM
jgi:hypothetical protein